MSESHIFRSELRWTGDTVDYDTFSRRHELKFPGGKSLPCATFLQSAGTDATNPEELLAASQSSCLMLTFLAVCSRSRVNVVAYEDHAEALLEKVEGRFRITTVTLRPVITVAGATEESTLRSLLEKAHDHCYIANSIRSEVKLEPVFRTA